jgi:hypothetical protein
VALCAPCQDCLGHEQAPRAYLALKDPDAGAFAPAIQIIGEGEAFEPAVAALPDRRFALAREEGTELEIEECPDSIVLRPKKPVPTTLLSDVVGCAGYRGPAKSLDDMEEAIARGVSERHARGRY